MKKKHCYEIIINKPSKKYREIVYDYSATKGKGIKLQISNNAIRIIANLSTLYENDNIVVSTNHIFSDAIKKALLLHLLVYSKNIRIKSMHIAIDGENSDIVIPHDAVSPPVYALVIGELEHKVPKAWTDSTVLNTLVSRTKSNQDSRWAAIFAALCAKNKSFEIERFIYLWMSFNGMYSYFSSRINPLRPLTKKGRKQPLSEKDELTWMMKLYNIGVETISKNDSKRIANEVIAVLRKYDISSIRSADDISENLKQEIENQLYKEDGKRYNITSYGYLLVSFAYYFRCNVFHADKPLPLFCYEDEIELKCLHLINTLLEEFIDYNLYKLFDDSYMNAAFEEKYKHLATLAE